MRLVIKFESVLETFLDTLYKCNLKKILTVWRDGRPQVSMHH